MVVIKVEHFDELFQIENEELEKKLKDDGIKHFDDHFDIIKGKLATKNTEDIVDNSTLKQKEITNISKEWDRFIRNFLTVYPGVNFGWVIRNDKDYNKFIKQFGIVRKIPLSIFPPNPDKITWVCGIVNENKSQNEVSGALQFDLKRYKK